MSEQLSRVQDRRRNDDQTTLVPEPDRDDRNDTQRAQTHAEPAPRRRFLRLPGAKATSADAQDEDDPGMLLGAGWLNAAGLAEGGLLADVGVVLDLTSIYLPLVGTVLSFAVPTPFAILMLRRGPRVTLLAATVSAFLITILAGPHFGWRMGLEAIIGLLLGWAMRRGIRPSFAFVAGILLVASTTFLAALGVILVSGLPISDVVGELRNGLGSLAWLVASGAAIFGFQSQWLAIRPTLVALGLLGLHVWPALLFLSLVATATPVVASYYVLANATARVLGYEVRPFPSHGFMRLVHFVFVVLTAPVALPVRGIRWLAHGRRQHKRNDNSVDDDMQDEMLSSGRSNGRSKE